jgi:glycosyltransferase involved in cell wall biosynthesis
MPKFSIILPVRNGGQYVKECVTSILRQTYEDFELLVLDNCSNDGTTNWLQSLEDDRVKLFPSSKSLSIEENWGRILQIPKSEFITLIGHDDRLEAAYLEQMNLLIQENPQATLYQSHFNYINSNGEVIRSCKPMPAALRTQEFLQRFLENQIDVMGTGFLMRAADYDAAGGIAPYPNLLFADFEIWLILIREGYLAVSPANLFSFRLHHSMTTASADIKFIEAFRQFSDFLVSLKDSDKALATVIETHSASFLQFYCQGLTHRLLRTPLSKRNGLRVKSLLKSMKVIADKLSVKGFEPASRFTIKSAILIDSNALFRGMFLLFKRIFKKPLLK